MIKFPADKKFLINHNLNFINMNYQKPNVKLEGKVATISGWGFTDEGTRWLDGDNLMVASNRIVKTDAIITDHVLSKTRILQMTQEGGRGVCDGDCGGTVLLV